MYNACILCTPVAGINIILNSKLYHQSVLDMLMYVRPAAYAQIDSFRIAKIPLAIDSIFKNSKH